MTVYEISSGVVIKTMGLSLASIEFIDCAATIIGLAIGIVYGFESWRGTKTPGLKTSPRLKELRLVVVVLFLAAISDMRAVSPDIQKPRFFSFYLVGFLIGAPLTIAAQSFSVWRYCRSVKRTNPHLYPIPPFRPVLDYIRYGYEYHETALKEAMEKKRQDQFTAYQAFMQSFLSAYSKYMREVTPIVFRLRAHPDEETKKVVTKQLVRCIQGIVEAYRNRDEPGVEINANYMVAWPSASLPIELRSRIVFDYGEPKDRYEYFLVLNEYAKDEGKEFFVLPVEGRTSGLFERQVLPGAPEAFLTGRAIVDDTSKITFRPDVPTDTKNQIQTYFRTKAFRSFASLRVDSHDATERLGVVNIESSNLRVLGRSHSEQDYIILLIAPFLNLLGFLHKR